MLVDWLFLKCPNLSGAARGSQSIQHLISVFPRSAKRFWVVVNCVLRFLQFIDRFMSSAHSRTRERKSLGIMSSNTNNNAALPHWYVVLYKTQESQVFCPFPFSHLSAADAIDYVRGHKLAPALRIRRQPICPKILPEPKREQIPPKTHKYYLLNQLISFQLNNSVH